MEYCQEKMHTDKMPAKRCKSETLTCPVMRFRFYTPSGIPELYLPPKMHFTIAFEADTTITSTNREERGKFEALTGTVTPSGVT